MLMVDRVTFDCMAGATVEGAAISAFMLCQKMQLENGYHADIDIFIRHNDRLYKVMLMVEPVKEIKICGGG